MEKEIMVIDKSFTTPKKYHEEDVLKQIILIRTIHNILMGYGISGETRINSTIGKFIESTKVEVKRCRIDFNELHSKNDKNIMDEYLLCNGEKVIRKGEEVIKLLKEIDYIGIIKRSMKKNEICLGRADEGNLRVVEEIEIGTLKDVRYNLVEEEIYDYLRRVRRRNPESDLEKYTSQYIGGNFFGENSREYLNILLSIPYDTIRSWKRYRINKREISPKEYVDRIKSSMKYEMGIW